MHCISFLSLFDRNSLSTFAPCCVRLLRCCYRHACTTPGYKQLSNNTSTTKMVLRSGTSLATMEATTASYSTLGKTAPSETVGAIITYLAPSHSGMISNSNTSPNSIVSWICISIHHAILLVGNIHMVEGSNVGANIFCSVFCCNILELISLPEFA
jgi:hypothetical protein